MAEFVEVPVDRVAPDSLQGLLEEYASRDGTDYGLYETPLGERVAELRRGLSSGELALLFNSSDESWDILQAERVRDLLGQDSSDAL